MRLIFDHFFKNNEYFNKHAPGYTLPGLRFRPTLEYYADQKLILSGGVQYNAMHGRDTLTDLKPFFRVRWQATPWLNLVMGSLYSHGFHDLPDAVVNPEYDLYKASEEGFQAVMNWENLQIDTWVDWNDFIWLNDKKNEKIWGGIVSKWSPRFGQKFKLEILTSATAWHTGGQIDDSSQPGQLMFNVVEGLNMQVLPNCKWFQQIAWGAELHQFINNSSANSEGKIPGTFKDGYASNLWFRWLTTHATWQISYWQAYNFYSPKGSWMYHNVSPFSDASIEHRQFFRLGHGYERKFLKKLYFGLSADVFYFPAENLIDHSLGLYLRYNTSFLLKKIPKELF